MIFDEWEQQLRPESKEELAEILVNSFANSGYCGYLCPFRKDRCDEIWPDTIDVFCNLIDYANKLGINVMLTKRDNTKNRETVERIAQADAAEIMLRYLNNHVRYVLEQIQKYMDKLGIEVDE